MQYLAVTAARGAISSSLSKSLWLVLVSLNAALLLEWVWRSRVMTSPNAVSMSMTTALIYGMSGGFFFVLVFLLVLMGMTNCDWPCCRFYHTLLILIQYVIYSIIQYPMDKIWKYLFVFAAIFFSLFEEKSKFYYFDT